MSGDPGHGSTTTLTWLGHGTVVVETAGVRVMVDPVLRNRVMHLRRREPLVGMASPNADAVLVTHAHHDHLDLPSLRRFPVETPKLAPRRADRVMRRHGIRSVLTVEVGATYELHDVEIEVVRAHHGGARLITSHSAVAVGYVLRSRTGPSVFLAGDTSLHEDMALLAPIDVAVLPVGGWWRDPTTADHLDPEQAFHAARLLDARVVVPIHWGTFYPLLMRRFMDPVWSATRARLDRLAADAPGIDLRVIEPGEHTELVVSRGSGPSGERTPRR